MKNDKLQPWQCEGVPWKDEKAFLTWLRGSVRRVWNRSPVKIAYKLSRRYKAPVGRNGKDVFVSDCEMCGKQSRKCDVDHLDGGYGFTDWESFCDWQKRILWVSFDDIRELCEPCHSAVTLSQRLNISVDEARVEQEAILILKEKRDRQWLLEQGLTPKSNQKLRRIQIVEKLKENLNANDKTTN